MIFKQMLDVCYDVDDEGSLAESKIMCIMFFVLIDKCMCSFVS